MKTIEIIGYKRANLGKKEAKQLRADSNVPCVLYGGKSQIHFYTPMGLFREIVYTPDAHIIKINIEGDEYTGILQDIQFHPVNEIILHADFLELTGEKEVKMDIPVKLEGVAAGVLKGGKLMPKLTKIRVKALPKNMPDYIQVDVTNLELGKSLKVADIATEGYSILNSPAVSIASVIIPRALRGKEDGAEDTK